MDFLRQYIAPLFIFLLFLVALAAVSARIFLPADMAGPAVMDDSISQIPLTQPLIGQISTIEVGSSAAEVKSLAPLLP